MCGRQRQRCLLGSIALQTVHVLETPGQFFSAAAAFTHILGEVAIGQLEKPFAGENGQGTLFRHDDQMDQQLQTTKKRFSWYEIKNYLLAVIPTGILTGLIFWLLTKYFG